MYKKIKLGNGLRIVTHRMPRMQSAAIGIWIKAGGRYENIKNKGVAHYIEHLLFKGSKKYSCKEIKESIEGVGGILNGFTSEEVTCFLVKIPARHLDLAVSVLSSMVINPLFKLEDIKKERTVILEEIKMYRDLPQSYVHELLDNLLWPRHPLGESILGTEESIVGMAKADLVSFKEEYYSPANLVVSVAGAFEENKLFNQLKNNFSNLSEKNKNNFLPVKEAQDRPQLKIYSKSTEQTHLALGFHGYRRDHPLKHALGLLNVILGGNMSSRLFNEVREKRGLAYEIGSQLKRFYDTGAFVVHAGIDNSKVEAAIGLILKELAKTKKSLVSNDEFKRAKDFYLGHLEMALEDTMDNMLWIGESTITLDKTYALEEVIKEVNKVERKDLLKTANDIFNNKSLNLALIGPISQRETPIKKQLKIA